MEKKPTLSLPTARTSLESSLFFGFPLSDAYSQELEKVDIALRLTFIQGSDSAYLHCVESGGVIYLGKYLGQEIKVDSLNTIQDHVYSMLKRLVGHYCYEGQPLILLSVPASSIG